MSHTGEHLCHVSDYRNIYLPAFVRSHLSDGRGDVWINPVCVTPENGARHYFILDT